MHHKSANSTSFRISSRLLTSNLITFLGEVLLNYATCKRSGNLKESKILTRHESTGFQSRMLQVRWWRGTTTFEIKTISKLRWLSWRSKSYVLMVARICDPSKYNTAFGYAPLCRTQTRMSLNMLNLGAEPGQVRWLAWCYWLVSSTLKFGEIIVLQVQGKHDSWKCFLK